METRTKGTVTLTGPFIGLVVTAVLFGFSILQASQYYMRFPKDSLISKSKVAFVCLLDLLHFVFTITLVHTFFISNLEVQGSLKNFWSLKATIITQTILTASVHFIYLQRIHILSNIPTLNKTNFSRIINVAILLVAFCATGAAAVFIYGVQKTEGVVASDIAEDLRWAIFIGFGATVAIDIVITTLTCLVLHKNRVEIGFNYISKWSNRMLLRLFKYSLATGLLTSIIAAVLIIVYLARPYTLDFMCLCLVMAKVYTNSLLSLAQYVRRQINNNLMGTNELKQPSPLVFGGVSQRTRWTTEEAISRNQTSPLLVGSDLELYPTPQYTENIKRPEVSKWFSLHDSSFEARNGVSNHSRIGEPEIIDEESWTSFRRTARRGWLNGPIERRSSL